MAFQRWFRKQFKDYQEKIFKESGHKPTQIQFAAFLEMGRASVNQHLKGKTVPPEGEIWKIIIKTNSNLADDLEDLEDQKHWRNGMLMAAKLLRRRDRFSEDLEAFMAYLQERIRKEEEENKKKVIRSKPRDHPSSESKPGRVSSG